MAFQVTLAPSGRTFTVEPGEKILAAGLGANLAMPYGCRMGCCRSCRGKVVEGKVDLGAVVDSYLPQAQRDMGYALLCQAEPLSDVVIEVQELDLTQIKPRKLPSLLKRIRKPAPDVAALDLRLPVNEPLSFAAGQYIDILLPDGKRRSYSIANPPSIEGVIDIQLHVRHIPGGAFTDRLFTAAKAGEVIWFEGPLGTFYWREQSEKPMILVASGTGYAPIRAIIRQALEKNSSRPMTLYWGCRTLRDLYFLEEPQLLAQRYPQLKFVPVLSEPAPDDEWHGRIGFVHRAVMEDLPDLSGHQVYACGAPAMVDAAREEFTAACGLPEEEFFADSFITASEAAGRERLAAAT
ncbi:MAG TPA: CDP-6-deoxy-delta-3,4-glucoseen reductase [Ramlibacter sp.]|nr:CDP-6-deoxy-delta-3,4-glucoseen reductase [Ramlibacter sp.]